jgi:hypothetical protein
MRAGDVVFFGTFDGRRPHPVILLDDGSSFLEASPAGGVNLGHVAQMRNRSIVTVRRYVLLPKARQITASIGGHVWSRSQTSMALVWRRVQPAVHR